MLNMPMPTMQVFQAQSPIEPIGTVAMPVRDHINTATVISLLQTDWAKMGPVDRAFVLGNILTTQRNEAIQRMRGEFLVFIDDDMVFPPDALSRLIANWNDIGDPMVILGGLCFRRAHPYVPTLYKRQKPTSGPYQALENWDYGSLVEVDATGTAFLLIPKAVFAKLLWEIDGKEFPSYEERKRMPPLEFFRWQGRMGEDLRFCQDAKLVGAKIYVDTSIEIGHVSEITVDYSTYLKTIMERPFDVEDEVRRVNNELGLPTLSREEASELLGS